MMTATHATGALSAERLSQLDGLEDWHFWFVERRQLVTDLLKDLPAGSTVLDVGSGTGRTAAALHRKRAKVVQIDRTPQLSAKRKEACTIAGDAHQLPFADGAFDAILMLDLLEHTADADVLAEVRRVTKAGGKIIVTVPAFLWLWSARDEAAGHRRRYTRSLLRKQLDGAGFHVEVLHYWQRILFPLVMITRLTGRRSLRTRDFEERPPRFVNRLCRVLLAADRRLGSHFGWLPGSSVIAVGRVTDRE